MFCFPQLKQFVFLIDQNIDTIKLRIICWMLAFELSQLKYFLVFVFLIEKIVFITKDWVKLYADLKYFNMKESSCFMMLFMSENLNF